MFACWNFERLLDGAIDDARILTELRDSSPHLSSCSRCSESLEVALLLAGVKQCVTIPNDELAAIRSRVVASGRKVARIVLPVLDVSLLASLRRIGPACAAALVGYVIGVAPWARRAAPDPGQLILSALAREARRPAPSEASAPGPYVLTDIRVLDADGDRVELRGIAGQEVGLSLDRRDPLLERAVVESWLRRGTLYQRLEAASLADARASVPVRAALLAVLRDDPSPAVRLAAAERLAPLSGERATVDAFLRVLRNDSNVAMKLAAADFLIESRVAPDLLRAAAESGDLRTRGPAVLRVDRYLRSIKD